MAAHDLATDIGVDLIDAGSSKRVDIDGYIRNIVKGFVYLEVPGFKTPIVKLYFGDEQRGDKVSEADIKKIVSHIKGEKKLLPVSSFLEPL